MNESNLFSSGVRMTREENLFELAVRLTAVGSMYRTILREQYGWTNADLTKSEQMALNQLKAEKETRTVIEGTITASTEKDWR